MCIGSRLDKMKVNQKDAPDMISFSATKQIMDKSGSWLPLPFSFREEWKYVHFVILGMFRERYRSIRKCDMV